MAQVLAERRSSGKPIRHIGLQRSGGPTCHHLALRSVKSGGAQRWALKTASACDLQSGFLLCEHPFRPRLGKRALPSPLSETAQRKSRDCFALSRLCTPLHDLCSQRRQSVAGRGPHRLPRSLGGELTSSTWLQPLGRRSARRP